MKARIGIDARMIRHSGIGTYLRGLLEGISKVHSDLDQFRLFGPENINYSAFPKSHFKAPIYSLTEQLQYPGRVSGCELWHSPHYNVPVVKGGSRLVVTIHDIIHWIFRKDFFTPLQACYAGFMLRRAVRSADRIITVSRKTREDLIEHFQAPPEKISVIYEGVFPCFRVLKDREPVSTVRKNYGLPDSFFLYIGVLKPHKNVQTLIRAFRRLRQDGKIKSGLVIAGKKDRSYRPEFRDLSELKTGGGVHYIPFVEPNDLVPLYNAALALVHPSLYEGFGLTLLEAMACGIPVAAFRAASIPEITGDAALLMEPGLQGEENIMDALLRLEHSSSLRQELIEKGNTRVRAFSWDEMARKTLDLYSQVLDGK